MKDVKEGDIVKIKTSDEEISGIILPSHEKDIVLVKLETGYNLGIEKKKIKKVTVTGHKKSESFPEADAKQKGNKPGIAMIVTGGTISSRLDYSTGAVKPLMSPQQLFFLAPKLFEMLKVNTIERPFNIFSENMAPKHWQALAKLIAELLNKKENKGVILTHGTDTLGYTAAALSFMLKNVNKPVVLTYSQRSTDRGSTDTVLNLTCAGYAALSDIAEVILVGHASPNDTFCYALRGTKARKMNTSRRDTFRPINELPIAEIYEDGKITTKSAFNKRDDKKKVIADTAFEEKVALIKYVPGADPKILDYYLSEGYRGVIIEAVGLGHVSVGEGKENWAPHIKKATYKGMLVCFAPQTIYGRLDPYVYASGRELLEAGAVYLEDMLGETAYVKLGWVLGHEKNHDKAKKLMLTNIAGEINKRISDDTFLF